MMAPATTDDRSILGRAIDSLLDLTVFFSFDRSGFLRHARTFRAGELDVNLAGRVCVVTGANSGIGLATATALAARRAEVWLLCRDRERGQAAAASIRKTTGNRAVHLEILDVSRLADVRAFAARFTPPRVDVLVHNAGVLPAARQRNPEGIELTLATNVVGPFLLTHLLRGRLEAPGRARVIFVSSGGMYAQRLSLDDLQWEKRTFDGVTAYAQTKRMQVVLANLFSRRWGTSGVAAHAMHPGWADTPSVRTSIPRFWEVMKNRLRTPEEGADTVAWLAVADGLPPGCFWFDRSPVSAHLLPFTAEEPTERDALWDALEGLAGLA